MKIFNIKINIQKFFWISIIIVFLLLIVYLISNNTNINMNNKNYTTILRDCHNDISKYLGRKITTSGYIFRGKDFDKNNFVVARDMLINESEANIVGFLCLYDQIDDFKDNEWVNIKGTIVLGDYYGPIPMIKVDTIERITTPEDIFVYPPK